MKVVKFCNQFLFSINFGEVTFNRNHKYQHCQINVIVWKQFQGVFIHSLKYIELEVAAEIFLYLL